MARRNLLIANLLIALMGTGGGVVGTSFAQKASVPKSQDLVALASDKVKELLLLIDTDNNGKVSKKKWMKFMEVEFDKLDQQNKGQIDPRELVRSNQSATQATFASVGK